MLGSVKAWLGRCPRVSESVWGTKPPRRRQSAGFARRPRLLTSEPDPPPATGASAAGEGAAPLARTTGLTPASACAAITRGALSRSRHDCRACRRAVKVGPSAPPSAAAAAAPLTARRSRAELHRSRDRESPRQPADQSTVTSDGAVRRSRGLSRDQVGGAPPQSAVRSSRCRRPRELRAQLGRCRAYASSAAGGSR